MVNWKQKRLQEYKKMRYVILDIVIITQLNRRFSDVPNLIREVLLLWDRTSESTKFDSFKLNTTFVESATETVENST